MSKEWLGAAEQFALNTAEHYNGVAFDTLVDVFMVGANYASRAYRQEIEQLESENLELLKKLVQYRSEDSCSHVWGEKTKICLKCGNKVRE
jgi:hypothetical protein